MSDPIPTGDVELTPEQRALFGVRLAAWSAAYLGATEPEAIAEVRRAYDRRRAEIRREAGRLAGSEATDPPTSDDDEWCNCPSSDQPHHHLSTAEIRA